MVLDYKEACKAISAEQVDLPNWRVQFNNIRLDVEVSIPACTLSGSMPQSRASNTGSRARAKSRPRETLSVFILSESTRAGRASRR